MEHTELEAAIAELREAAASFDEWLTEMVTVQRRLIKVVRAIDRDSLDSLGPMSASELVVELRALSAQLRSHASTPETTPIGARLVPNAGPSRSALRRAAREADLRETLPAVLAERPVDVHSCEPVFTDGT